VRAAGGAHCACHVALPRSPAGCAPHTCQLGFQRGLPPTQPAKHAAAAGVCRPSCRRPGVGLPDVGVEEGGHAVELQGGKGGGVLHGKHRGMEQGRSQGFSTTAKRCVCVCVCVWGGGGTAGTRQAPPAAPRLQPILTHQPSDAVRAATQTDARPPMGSLPASQPWMSWLAGTPAAPPPASCQLPAARCCGSCGAAERGPPPTWISALLRTIWYSWSTCLCRWGSSVSSGLRGDSKAASGEGQGVGYARAAGKDRSRRGVGGRPQGRGWDREGSGPQNRRPPQLAPHALFACHRHQPDCPASPATASITPSACPTFPLQHDPEHPSACQHSPSAHLSLSRWRRHDA
jgi:hypothetical protein